MKAANTFSLLLAIFIFGACYLDIYKDDNGKSSGSYYSEADPSDRSSSSPPIALHDSVRYKEQSYKAVKIGSQVWMVQNLKAKPSSGESWCHGMLETRCNSYGRLYDWTAASTVCTGDWRLPSKADFDNLLGLGALLSSSVGWNALPLGGLKKEDDDDYRGYGQLDTLGYWWASDNSGDEAWYVSLEKGGIKLDGAWGKKTRGYSVRCVQK